MFRVRSVSALLSSKSLAESRTSLLIEGSTAQDISNKDADSMQLNSDSESHPRGHQTYHKRVRHIALWLYYRFGSKKAQLLAATLTFLSLALWSILSFYWQPGQHPEASGIEYAVYIDGGSSGTRVHVFQYIPKNWPEYVQLVLPEQTYAVEPGLSSYAGRAQEAAQSLLPLIEFAKQKVPQQAWSTTPVYLLATAGLRLLPNQDAQDILQTASRMISSTAPFLHKPHWAKVISGDAEGVFAWVAVNYVTGALQDSAVHQHLHTRKDMMQFDGFHGVLELGGASFQVTYMLPVADKNTETTGLHIPLPGVSRRVFTHSFLGLGMDAALHAAADIVLQQQQRQRKSKQSASKQGATVALDPCLPSGYQTQDGRIGDGSFKECLRVVQQVLPGRHCAAAEEDEENVAAMSDTGSLHTIMEGPCSFAGVQLPHAHGTQFVALENFYWTAAAVQAPARATLSEIERAGARYCSLPWSTLQQRLQNTVADHFISRYCFGAAYIFALLHDRLGIPYEERTLHFTNTISRSQLKDKQHGESDEHQRSQKKADSEELGNTSGPVNVGLSWVVGAVLMHAMSSARRRTCSSFNFWCHWQTSSTAFIGDIVLSNPSEVNVLHARTYWLIPALLFAIICILAVLRRLLPTSVM